MTSPERAASVVVDGRGALLVVRRVARGRRYCVLPGGGVEPGEDPASAALRELEEETGLLGRVERRLARIDHTDRRAHYFSVRVDGADQDAVALGPGSPEHARQTGGDLHEPAWISLSALDVENLQPEEVRALVLETARDRVLEGDRLLEPVEETPLEEVAAVLEALRAAGCRAWVAGGWGVDALVGRQTRRHRDLDLAVDAHDEGAILAALARRGYVVETDQRPVRVELAREGRGRVDVHPVVFGGSGHGRQPGLDGQHFDYPPAAFAVGSLGGADVGCLSVPQQLDFHRGYAPRPVDLHDLGLLEAVRVDVEGAGTPMRAALLASVLPALLADVWGVPAARVGPSGGPTGMSSVVVEVELPGHEVVVAKWVPEAAAEALDRGSATALEVERAGVPAGAPVPTRAGALSAACRRGRVALLRRVPGRPLTGAGAVEQRRMAEVLARLHAVRHPVLRREPYLAEPLRAARDVEPWVRASVGAVLDEYAGLPALVWGLVHHDPAPEAFFHDERTGSTALIDWTGAGEGPVLFDVASAVMYLGGPVPARPFLDAYAGLVPPDRAVELRAHLDTLLRFRGAVQAAYFSVRVAERDLTGVAGQADNVRGLQHARRLLVAGGVAPAAYPVGAGGVLRSLRPEDLDALVAVQEEGSVAALSHVFDQATTPFPRDAVRERWERELADRAVDCFVIGLDGQVDGFAAVTGAELLHFGTARWTWGSGLAREAHDELLDHLRERGRPNARLWVFEENHHARRFYERRGWTADGRRTRSAFAPNPVLLGYARDLGPGPVSDGP